jgi:hypothetical protein
VLLGQLGSNGDCLYATAIAKQIKRDDPKCHLVWAIGRLSRPVLVNNPDIDEIWQLPHSAWTEDERLWNLFEIEAHRLADAGQFDSVHLTQIAPARFANYDGTIRPSIFRNYGRPLSVPVDVTIELSEEEIAAVDNWVRSTPAADASQIVLLECSSKSGQSFMTVDLALGIAEVVTNECRKAVVIISTHEPLRTDNSRILECSLLSVRQMARLTRFADLFVGCGSGITVAATSGAAKRRLPVIQILKRSTSYFASFRQDFRHFGKPHDNFLEVTREEPEHICRVILDALRHGFAAAQADHDDPVPLSFEWYRQLITMMLLDRGRYIDAVQSLLVTTDRFGWHDELVQFARQMVLPFLPDDPRHVLPHWRCEIDRLRDGLAQQASRRG